MEDEPPQPFDDPPAAWKELFHTWLREPLSIPADVVQGRFVAPPDFDRAALRQSTHFGLEAEDVEEGGFEDVIIELLKGKMQEILDLLGLDKPDDLDLIIGQQVRLAAIAYTDCIDTPQRKTGEPTRFHAERMALYFLDSWIDCLRAMDSQISLRTRPEYLKQNILNQTLSLLMGVLFHDLGEDIAGEGPDSGKTFMDQITFDKLHFPLKRDLSPFSLRQFAQALPGRDISDYLNADGLAIRFSHEGNKRPHDTLNDAAWIIYGLTTQDQGFGLPQRRGKFIRTLRSSTYVPAADAPFYISDTERRSHLFWQLKGIYELGTSPEFQLMRNRLRDAGYPMGDLDASFAQYLHLRDTACRHLYLEGKPLLAAGVILTKIMDLLDNMLTRDSPDTFHLAKKSQEAMLFIPHLIRDLNYYLTTVLYEIDLAGSTRTSKLPGMYQDWPVLPMAESITKVYEAWVAALGPLLGVTQTVLYDHPEVTSVMQPDGREIRCSIPRPGAHSFS